MHLLLLFKAGKFAIITVAEPGVQGAGITGVQGIGVNTPNAAAVAAATAGLAGDLHIAKGGMFTKGLLSIILAAGLFSAMVLLAGKTTNVLGATPIVHINPAPIFTCIATLVPY
jgi:hypothetical protein